MRLGAPHPAALRRPPLELERRELGRMQGAAPPPTPPLASSTPPPAPVPRCRLPGMPTRNMRLGSSLTLTLAVTVLLICAACAQALSVT